MATITWIGGSSTSANTDANWSTGSKPAAGDVALFDNNATANCVWDIGTPDSPTLSVDEIIVESTFATGGSNRTITLDTKPRIKGLFANGTIVAGSSSEIIFESGFGSYKEYSNRYVLIGDNSVLTGLTFNMKGTGVKFDDGQHPTVVLDGGTYGPDYETPTGTSGKASFTAFTISDTATSFAPLAAVDANDRLKVFDFTAFTCNITGFDAGESTFEFLATSGGFNLPVTTSTLTPVYRKVVLKAGTAGHKVVVADNSILTCDELEIQDGCMMIGPQGTDKQGADVRVTLPPKIRGSWSFGQISNGLYRSPKHAVGPLPTVTALKMTGEIEATTITLNAVPADPATDDKVRIGESGAGNMFQIQTNRGNIQIGRNSGAYAHIYTDADQFYFSKPILVDGGGQVFGYNDGLYLGTGTSASGGTTAITVANGSTNITVAGNIAVGGTVDGIDIATDVAANTAKVTNATHSGEVTGATALTIADNVVDEANLKVSNSPTNGYALTAQSAASGGLTWAAMSGGGSALEFAEYRMVNHNPSTSSSNDFNSNTRWVADLADTSFWTAATTASDHTSIVLHTDGYLTLAANGIYDVWFSTDIFGHGSSAANIDSFIEISTNNSGDRRYATTRKVIRINGVNVKYNHQTTAKIRTGGSAVNIYFSAYLNGCGYYLAAYNDYRTSVKVIRLGDA